jgi:hypothetical protein
MTSSRTTLEAAAGKLIAAIQKEWGIEAGEPESAASENVMHAAHELLQAASKFGSIVSVIGSGSGIDVFGRAVGSGPSASPAIHRGT